MMTNMSQKMVARRRRGKSVRLEMRKKREEKRRNESGMTAKKRVILFKMTRIRNIMQTLPSAEESEERNLKKRKKNNQQVSFHFLINLL